MFPMHGGFMGRKGVSGFRFLHDEISGGVFAYSHLKCKAAYAGNAVTVATNDYAFVDNLSPVAQIRIDFPVLQNIVWYEQLNSYDTGVFQGWSGGVDYNNQRYLNTGTGFSRDLNQPKTIVMVNNISATNGGGFGSIYSSATQFQSVWSFGTGSNTLAMRKRNGGQSTRVWNSGSLTGWHLIVITDDGSLDGSGWNLYFNDMTTAVSVNSTTVGAVTNLALPIIGFKDFQINSVQFTGIQNEYHLFDGVLSTSERNDLKTILQQYPEYLANLP